MMADRPQKPNHDLLDKIAEDFDRDPDVAIGTMFQSPGLRVGRKVFAFLGHHGHLIVKLPRDRVNHFVDTGIAEPVVMGTRTMREWIAFPCREDRAATLALWRNVAQEAYLYVDSLQESS
jgi:hypothetical protein